MKSLKLTLLFTLLLGVAYPLLITALSHLFFHREAKGSLIVKEGAIVGSELIAQPFDLPRYFHPRPSSAKYDGAGSAGSNLGPTSDILFTSVFERIESYRKENGVAEGVKLPADSVTASGSGLDPHISSANALLQATRVATARNLPLSSVLSLIEKMEKKKGFLGGEARVNVLALNLALDEETGHLPLSSKP